MSLSEGSEGVMHDLYQGVALLTDNPELHGGKMRVEVFC